MAGKKRVYISGKMTGLPKWYIPIRFRHAEKKLRAAGMIPVNPAGLIVPEDWGLDYEDYMSIDHILLSKCDAIYLLSNWEGSSGANREKKWAEEMSLEIMYEENRP